MDTGRAIEAIWRIESAKLIARLTRIVRDVGIAEELAQDTFLSALESWPRDGMPDNPGAWLMTAAKRRAIDHLRRAKIHDKVVDQLQEPVGEVDVSDGYQDDLLRLMFMCCHPVLASEAQIALTLRVLGGLTTEEIARGFLVPTPTVAQRIVRAKKALADNAVQFEAPDGEDRDERLSSVMDVLYLVFNEGYSATQGDDWMRPALCDEALRLGRMLAELAPADPEVHGLVALMEIQASRVHARTGPGGEPVLLLDQDRGRWDQLLIRRGLAALARAEVLGVDRGPRVLQAAIAACHARARTAADTDWVKIAALYSVLASVDPSPIVELNRAVAMGMAFGPAAGLELVDALVGEPALAQYHHLPSVRADLLAKLGRHAEARQELERAAALTQNAREKALLLKRAAAL